jgi:cation diffusion facilitator family transporter
MSNAPEPSTPETCPQEMPRLRANLIRRGLRLALFTVIWNVLEGAIAVASGIMAGSIALVGFGIDSFIETTSAVVVGWRFSYEMRDRLPAQIEKAEAWSARIAGALLLALAFYILLDSSRRLICIGHEPEPSMVGIALTAVSLAVMPLLGRAKLRIAERLDSKALRADAYESITCAWLSATTLAGLVVNAASGWWWADPLAALVLTPLIVREGLEGLGGGEA